MALPKNIFFGTDIVTYLWILDNKRPEERSGKVLLIDASHQELVDPLQKSLGKKRFNVGQQLSEAIVKAYRSYQPKTIDLDGETVEVAKLVNVDDFRYTKVTVERPLRLRYSNISKRLAEIEKDVHAALEAEKPKKIIKDNELRTLHQTARHLRGLDPMSDNEVFSLLKEKGMKPSASEIKLIRKWLGEVDPTMAPVREAPYKHFSSLLPNTDLRDYELVPFKRDIDEYFQTEVIPYVSDAWMDRSKDKEGVEFPFTKMFYVYRPAEDVTEILKELQDMEGSFEDVLASLMK